MLPLGPRKKNGGGCGAGRDPTGRTPSLLLGDGLSVSADRPSLDRPASAKGSVPLDDDCGSSLTSTVHIMPILSGSMGSAIPGPVLGPPNDGKKNDMYRDADDLSPFAGGTEVAAVDGGEIG